MLCWRLASEPMQNMALDLLAMSLKFRSWSIQFVRNRAPSNVVAAAVVVVYSHSAHYACLTMKKTANCSPITTRNKACEMRFPGPWQNPRLIIQVHALLTLTAVCCFPWFAYCSTNQNSIIPCSKSHTAMPRLRPSQYHPCQQSMLWENHRTHELHTSPIYVEILLLDISTRIQQCSICPLLDYFRNLKNSPLNFSIFYFE